MSTTDRPTSRAARPRDPGHGRPGRGAGAALACLVVALSTSCASMPTSGPVMDGDAEVSTAVEVGFNVQGPAADAEPEQLVSGFVSVAQLGPASVSTANVAREYVQPDTWSQWDRYARVLVLAQYPEWVVPEVDDSTTTTTVSGRAEVVATLDEGGVYTELAEPSEVDVSYDLARDTDGQWRISGMDDGMLVLANFLSDAFHRTTLYYPTPDFDWWVPDVRWFPSQSWRTEATRELLSGPPEALAQSAVSVVPDGTTLAIDAVTVDAEGVIEVPVTSAITGATADERAMFVAQLEETLRDGEGRSVTLSDGTSPLAVTPASEPSRPLTVGDAVAVLGPQDGQTEPVLRRVVGRELTDTPEPVDLAGLDPTAVATGPDDSSTVVVRDGADRLVRVSADARSELLRGQDVLAPSVDRFGAVWTAVDDALWAVLDDGTQVEVPADWVGEQRLLSLRVSPEATRVAVVLDGADGAEVWVAGIERDAADVPTGLSEPLRVGGTVASVTSADWYEESALLLLGRDVDGARAVFLAGVGGLPGTGASRLFTSPSSPTAVAAGVGARPPMIIGEDGLLQVRQSAALWPSVAEGVLAVAYPG
ncbi:LpqB family beta-propeller domain-containing protein [Isoptericola jiangsuensis]|uniref:LpqB family beta-propeller domain-containing protein n=1 Tax=Isoptericola jiangsuensis TaxID=548579 RepID=UPI003AAED5A8